ncbi:SPOC like C-terminal domain-containing protein [Syncephalastrum racemosum]|uniref:ATP-dependent DNA helicase II subunit 1 n=1 Tax=Syncephalastrum racemosum TaxID=13706 RepID=A0A1X2H6U1_SYNRA|nr:SPOC like C-terminal domain-containing protein [Syncephalastrum racemosum]
MSTSFNFNDEEDEDEFVSDALRTSFENKDAILFVIECSDRMNTVEENGKTALQIAFQCVQNTLLNKTYSSPTDLVGVLLFNTDKAKNTSDHSHIYVLQDLSEPSVPNIAEAEAFATGERDVKAEFGFSREEYPYGNVFWACSDLFANSPRTGTKRLFLITSEDDPHHDNDGLRRSALQRAKDLWELGIRIELFGLSLGKHTFTEKLFYSQVMDHEDATGDEYALTDPSHPIRGAQVKLSELLTFVRRKEVKKRSEFTIPFHLAKGFTIGIRGYSMVMQARKTMTRKLAQTFRVSPEDESGSGAGAGGEGPSTSRGSGATSTGELKEIESVTTYICSDTNQILMPQDIKHVFQYGGENVIFSKEEMKDLQYFGDAQLLLQGFKHRSVVKPYYNVTHSHFIYPDEQQYEGSTRTFTALLRAALRKDMVGIAVLNKRVNAMPRLVALVPQQEELDEDGAQIRPPGFAVIILPFANDIRPTPVDSTPQAPDVLTDAMKDLTAGIWIKGQYDPMAYPNPVLQRYYAGLQALALDKDLSEVEGAIQDRTIPDYEMIEQRVGEKIKMYNSIMVDLDLQEREPETKRKMPPSSAGGEGSAKRLRGEGDKSIEDLHKDGQLNKCTLPELKGWLNEKGVKPVGRKADIIAQVESVLGK